MNQKYAKEYLPYIQALAEGKQLQMKEWGDGEDEWIDANDPSFVEGWDFRVKPEPREFWTVIYSDGQSMSMGWSKEGAKSHLKDLQNSHPSRFEDAYVAKVREII